MDPFVAILLLFLACSIIAILALVVLALITRHLDRHRLAPTLTPNISTDLSAVLITQQRLAALPSLPILSQLKQKAALSAAYTAVGLARPSLILDLALPITKGAPDGLFRKHAHQVAALGYYGLNDLASARAHLALAIEEADTNTSSNYSPILIQILLLEGNLPKAVAMLDAMPSDQQPFTRSARAQLAFMEARYEEALAYLDGMLTDTTLPPAPDNVVRAAALSAKALAFSLLGQPSEALTNLDELTPRIHSSHVKLSIEIQCIRAHALGLLAPTADAQAALLAASNALLQHREAIRLQIECLPILASAAAAIGNSRQALEFYDRALQLDAAPAESAAFLWSMGQLHRSLNDHSSAHNCLQSGAALNIPTEFCRRCAKETLTAPRTK